jgi:hypothetical protein
MRKGLKGVMLVALVCAVIIISGSCQLGVATDEKPGNPPKIHEAQIKKDERGKWGFPTLRIKRGERFSLNAGNMKFWLLFPADFNFVKGKATICKTDAFLAVAIDKGGFAVIEVPEYFPNPEEDQTVRFSFMFMERDGANWGDWQYAHGPESPPGMIIPKKHG